MSKLSLCATSALASSTLLIAMMASPAYGQTTSGATEDVATQVASQTVDVPTEATQTNGEDIVVTGSRIARSPNEQSAVPVTTVSGDEFFETGKTSVGDVLNDLPALRSTFSQANSTRFLGTSGLNLLDLRGLGTQRTLVLVNGRRHVAGDILSTASSVDTNTIPTDLIDRVDVVTGGNSAVYGSDALAGVVNFVLKDHYEGIQIRGQGGISKYKDAGSDFVSLLAGKNFADGRGNIAVNLEYAHQEQFFASGRDRFRQVNGFVTVDSDPANTLNGSDGVTDTAFFRDIRQGYYANAGTILVCCSASQPGFATALQPYIFNNDGTLSPQTGTRIPTLTLVPSYVGGNGDNFRDGSQFAFQPNLDRYSANIVGHFEISPAFVPFVEASYSRTDSFGSASGPFFTSAVGEVFHTDNPYLTGQARGIIRAGAGDYYNASGSYYADGINDADQFGFSLYKNAVDLTNRAERARRETYRIVAGVRGDFSNSFHYEVSGNYGQFNEKTAILGNVDLQRYLLSIDAVDQGQATSGVANGRVVCRSQVDPASGSAYFGANNQAFAQSRLANDIASCVPVNLFGNGTVSQAARDYLLFNSFAKGRITQLDLTGFVSGDTSSFFNLPGGAIGFSVGAEYRRETAYYKQDDVTAAGLTFYNAIPQFRPPSFEVKEAFGEIRIPLLKDTPFFQELTVSAAGRVSDYKGSTGTVGSYNAGVEWSPVRGLRLRGNYARAVRAPNLSDLYTPLGQNYASVADPCDALNIGTGSSTRAANCAADGVPANFKYQYIATLGVQSGGNADLKAEKSDSYTIGGVLAPVQIPGLVFSADYYNITVNNVITAPSAQDILNLCYDAASIDNQFCALFSRNTGPGRGPFNEIPGRILENSLLQIVQNYAKLKVSGIDFDLSYTHRIGDLGTLQVHGVYTWALTNNSYFDLGDPGRYDRTLGELGDPEHAANLQTAFKTGPFTLGYTFRYIGQMVPGAWEDTHSVQGRDPQNADAYPIRYYHPVTYHDVRFDIAVDKQFNFYLGVDNVLDKFPPFGLTGAGGGSAIYRNLGRFMYAGAKATF